MTEVSVLQRPPAVKVGGRRLSISSKPKHHTSSAAQPAESPEVEPVDYPRPAPPGEEHAHAPPHNDEEIPKKEKKQGHGNHENEKKLKESAHRKMEMNRPTRDMMGGKRDFGGAGRIAQPAGKMV